MEKSQTNITSEITQLYALCQSSVHMVSLGMSLQATIYDYNDTYTMCMYDDFPQSVSLGARSDVLNKLPKRHIFYIYVAFLHCILDVSTLIMDAPPPNYSAK